MSPTAPERPLKDQKLLHLESVHILLHVCHSFVLWQKAAPGCWVWHRSVPPSLWLCIVHYHICRIFLFNHWCWLPLEKGSWTAALIQSNPLRPKRQETFFSIKTTPLSRIYLCFTKYFLSFRINNFICESKILPVCLLQTITGCCFFLCS